jgi:hypothetical protein
MAFCWCSKELKVNVLLIYTFCFMKFYRENHFLWSA